MADIELVIKISEEEYHRIASGFGQEEDALLLEKIFKNGTPLPKGHGRLIDGDRFDVISYQHTSDDFDNGVMWLAKQIDNAPTIIEADKTESEDI